MYHVKITDDTGRVVTESDGDGLVLIHHSEDEGGLHCLELVDGITNGEMLSIIMGLDYMKNKILDGHPILKVMYAIRDEFVGGVMEIDLGALMEQIGGDDNDDDS